MYSRKLYLFDRCIRNKLSLFIIILHRELWEGPTPVSALIHAATMVTAGVYLLIRSSSLIEYSSTVLLLCLWLGAITTVFSSLIGLFQQDIKKVIAYSTMSQLAQKYTELRSIFRHQTICVEAICNIITIANSQITKARDYLYNNHCNFKFFNSFTIIRLYMNIMSVLIKWKFEITRKLVGISEAIRLILVFIKLKLINLELSSKGRSRKIIYLK